MTEGFWFNRMVEDRSLPTRFDLPDLVRRARLQLVQAGTFGPMFYGLADDPTVDRGWVGMPLVGIEANLELAARTIAGVQAAGARFVGQLSLAWNYGDHETGKGLFGVWDRIWTEPLLGTAPCADPAAVMERLADGALRCWPIEGRPYRTYSGCFCNPLWVATLKAMVTRAIGLGVDGLMAHHNFTSFCGCQDCRQYLLERLPERFGPAEVTALYGGSPAEAGDLRAPAAGVPPALATQFRLQLDRWAHRRRKEIFDEVLTLHGRALKPDLLLTQWYHKYDFGPQDERSLLPPGEWARDESYIWYSQGGHKGESHLEHGYLADTGMPARFIHAAGGGRPFITNKYDYRRLRLSIAEAAANGGAALAFHVPGAIDAGDELTRDEYLAAVVRYEGFLADNEALYHPARPWASVALVYPRREELEAQPDCLDALKRAGRVLEDNHILFDIVLDERVAEACGAYAAVIVPRPAQLTSVERDLLRDYAAGGGALILLEEGPVELLSPGAPPSCGLPGPMPAARVWQLAARPWTGGDAEVRPGVRLPVWPAPEADQFGRDLLDLLDGVGARCLRTDAPWYVRVRAWRPAAGGLALHWVNYRQDEGAATETPWPVGPVAVDGAVPAGERVERIDWLRPESGQTVELPFVQARGRVRFSLPQIVVYGITVMRTVGQG